VAARGAQGKRMIRRLIQAVVVGAVAACLAASLVLLAAVAADVTGTGVQAEPPASAGEPWQESYIGERQVQEAYGAAADEIDAAQAGKLLLELVNGARREKGVGALVWDELAATTAQQHAAEMAQQHYVNHYSLAGLKCEARYNALGGTDEIAENIAYYEINYQVYVTPQLVRRMHQHWMESASHSANALDAAHTQLGCAFVVVRDGGRSYVAGVVEFINHYGDYARLPQESQPGQALHLAGTLDPQRARLLYVGLGSEDLPFERTVAYQMSHIGGYSPPEVTLALLPAGQAFGQSGATASGPGPATPEVLYHRYNVEYDEASGRFSVDIKLEGQWPRAAYYVTLWATTAQPAGGEGQRRVESASSGAFCTMCQVVLVQ
jgi:uncharacterized protein YkwD